MKILYILVLYYTYLYCFPCNQLLFILFRIALIEEIVNNVSAEPGVTYISWEHEKDLKTDNEDSDPDDDE